MKSNGRCGWWKIFLFSYICRTRIRKEAWFLVWIVGVYRRVGMLIQCPFIIGFCLSRVSFNIFWKKKHRKPSLLCLLLPEVVWFPVRDKQFPRQLEFLLSLLYNRLVLRNSAFWMNILNSVRASALKCRKRWFLRHDTFLRSHSKG